MQESKVVSGVREIQLENWREFISLSYSHFAEAPAYIYRGQERYDWPLESRLDRLERAFPKRKNLGCASPKFFECPPFTEEEQLNAFRRAIRGRRGADPRPLTEDELWALGQHHGLATPLLDWTRSPFVALFFAFEEEAACENRGVYALSTAVEALFRSDDKEPTLKLVSPDSDVNYRLISQGALFTRIPRHAHVEELVVKLPCQVIDPSSPIFVKLRIPNDDRHGCLIALNKMNINHMTLFADIDGAAKHVNSLWQPGHEDSLPYV